MQLQAEEGMSALCACALASVDACMSVVYMCTPVYVSLHTTNISLTPALSMVSSYMRLHTRMCTWPCYCCDPGDPRPPDSFCLGFTVCPMRLVPGPRWGQKE